MMLLNPYLLAAASPSAPAIGDAYQGGYYAGDIVDGGNTYRIVVAPKAGEAYGKVWKYEGTSTAGTDSTTNGLANSLNMLDGLHAAGAYAMAYTAGGYDDWYLPSSGELAVIAANLRPGGAGTPSAFKTGGAQAFAAGAWYWSSTQYSVALARAWPTPSSEVSQDTKASTGNYTRPVRRVPA